MTTRLTQEDWLSAGFRSLAEIGPQALKAEALARKLNTTKGSFYWHFKDVPSFKAAMLALWRERAVTNIIDALDTLPDPKTRLVTLGEVVSQSAPERFGGRRAEAAIRAWGLADAEVDRAVQEVDAQRMDYLRNLLLECGLNPDHATLLYGAYVGLDQLSAQGDAPRERGMSALIELMLAR